MLHREPVPRRTTTRCRKLPSSGTRFADASAFFRRIRAKEKRCTISTVGVCILSVWQHQHHCPKYAREIHGVRADEHKRKSLRAQKPSNNSTHSARLSSSHAQFNSISNAHHSFFMMVFLHQTHGFHFCTLYFSTNHSFKFLYWYHWNSKGKPSASLCAHHSFRIICIFLSMVHTSLIPFQFDIVYAAPFAHPLYSWRILGTIVFRMSFKKIKRIFRHQKCARVLVFTWTCASYCV